jgi:hypothetical protein
VDLLTVAAFVRLLLRNCVCFSVVLLLSVHIDFDLGWINWRAHADKRRNGPTGLVRLTCCSVPYYIQPMGRAFVTANFDSGTSTGISDDTSGWLDAPDRGSDLLFLGAGLSVCSTVGQTKPHIFVDTNVLRTYFRSVTSDIGRGWRLRDYLGSLAADFLEQPSLSRLSHANFEFFRLANFGPTQLKFEILPDLFDPPTTAWFERWTNNWIDRNWTQRNLSGNTYLTSADRVWVATGIKKLLDRSEADEVTREAAASLLLQLRKRVIARLVRRRRSKPRLPAYSHSLRERILTFALWTGNPPPVGVALASNEPRLALDPDTITSRGLHGSVRKSARRRDPPNGNGEWRAGARFKARPPLHRSLDLCA